MDDSKWEALRTKLRRRAPVGLALLAVIVGAAVVTDQGCGAGGDGEDLGAGSGGMVQMEPASEASLPRGVKGACARRLEADVVAIDQPYTYNRFGSFNPAGMMYALKHDVVSAEAGTPPGPGNAILRPTKRPRPLVLRMNVGDCLEVTFTNWLAPARQNDDQPMTRAASMHIKGVEYMSVAAFGSNVGRNPPSSVEPGRSITFTVQARHEGTFLIQSMSALVGGEGMGGSLVLGLFGALNVQAQGSGWYRSQVTHEELSATIRGRNPDGTPIIDYEKRDPSGKPILNMLQGNRLVHSDLTAIIVPPGPATFREVTVIFHDELKTVHPFAELNEDEVFAGVRDAFGINYGASGMGSIVLAHRQRIGPAADCVECKFEEFFLTSWANGDPALMVGTDASGRADSVPWPDDPSNVYHSYLGDPLIIRNMHAGPAEQHVFHLHAHQWQQNQVNANSSYLDSQTLGPGATFTYDMSYGGSGNRTMTPGDSIFHCHLYPHFASGMWGLWRVHDVFEDGAPDRNLRDGEIADGTPTPAVVPLPDRALAPLPTWEPTPVMVDGTQKVRPPMPGYPHYIAGIPGKRPPQPPLDMPHSGGLQRHLVVSGEADSEVERGRRGRFDVELRRVDLQLLPEDGTALEKAAMQFHAGQFPGGVPFTTRFGWDTRAYPGWNAWGRPAYFPVNGRPPTPGAPYADPCPAGTPMRRYRATYLQTDVVTNKSGWHDPQARLITLERDAQATLSGARLPEPFFIRANSGDCVEFEATNLIPDALEEDDFQIFTPTETIGQHIHLVKFDVTSSDGAANGWNYEDGTFAAAEVRARIAAANANGGARPASETHSARLDIRPASTGAGEADAGPQMMHARITLAPEPHPRLSFAPLGAQSTIGRWWVDPLLDSGGADRTLSTVFTHDHFAPSSHQQHGLYGGLLIQPPGSTWRDPGTGQLFGTRDDGGPTSWRADIIAGPGGRDSYREFGLTLADFALLYDADGRPVNPPIQKEEPLPIGVGFEDAPRPQAIAASDPGSMVINYRNEPIPLRIGEMTSAGFIQRTDARGEMQNVFRSDIHGDPATPLLRGYPGDAVRLRLLGGAHEELHGFSVNGHRWRFSRVDADSGFVGAQEMAISEFFEFELTDGLPQITGLRPTSDYLYRATAADDLWNGLWGLMRSYRDPQPDLWPLPNTPQQFITSGALCPKRSPRRSFDVVAVLARDVLPGGKLVYNKRFDLYDPDAILFVQRAHLAGLRSGKRKPEPLILRAAAGECITVRLENQLPEVVPQTPGWSLLPPIIDGFNKNQVRTSNHVSLHPTMLAYDVNASDGTNAGFNPPQSVAPGQSRFYTWYAGRFQVGVSGPQVRIQNPVEFGVVPLRDDSDVVHRGRQGAVGALVIQPLEATWKVDPHTEAQATVHFWDDDRVQSFRELVLVYQNEVQLHSDDPRFQCIDTSLNCGTALRNVDAADDAEDTGHVAVNYATEPLWARLGQPPEVGEDLNDLDQSMVLSSRVHGDPETPLFRATVGEPVRVRVVLPSGHARLHGFTLHGHTWQRSPWRSGRGSAAMGPNPMVPATAGQSTITAMLAHNVLPYAGAGGTFNITGDYLWHDPTSTRFTGGLWGLMRVTPRPPWKHPPKHPHEPGMRLEQ